MICEASGYLEKDFDALQHTKEDTPYREVAVKNFLDALQKKVLDTEEYKKFNKLFKGEILIKFPEVVNEKLLFLESKTSIKNALSTYYIEFVYVMNGSSFVGMRLYSVQPSKYFDDKIGYVKMSLSTCPDPKVKKLILADMEKLYKKYL